uniref:DUF541 domain-containing protein n=1 Tax=Thermodesulfobacterium geofontis TaxID=1295609 RepID=A0A7C4NWD5_9BACT
MLNTKIALAEENKGATKVYVDIEDKRDIIPDVFKVKVEVYLQTKKETDAINVLGEVDKNIRKLGLEYKGGQYSVRENCWWYYNEKVCEGFNGEIVYVFELKDFTQQNLIFDKLDSLSKKYKELHFNVSEPVWDVSKETMERVEEELKFTIIDKAQNFAKEISKRLNKTCSITSINYKVNRYEPPFFRDIFLKGAVKEEKSVAAPEPKKEKQLL